MAKGWDSVRLDEIEPIAVVGRHASLAAGSANARHRSVRDQRVRGARCGRRRRRGAHRALPRARRGVRRAGRPSNLHARRRDCPRSRRDSRFHPRRGREAARPCRGAGTSVLAIGGPRDAVYEPSAWEDFFACRAPSHRRRLRRLPRRARIRSRRRPDHPGTLYHLACAEALAGRPDDAVAHLRRALELRPELAEHASADEDFVSLRERPDWPV